MSGNSSPTSWFDPALTRRILGLSYPVMLAMLSQTLINQVDHILVGHLPLAEATPGQTAVQIGSLFKAGDEWQFQAVGAGYQRDLLDFVPEEFPSIAPPPVTGARANIVEDDLLVQWDELQQRSIDYVEVRAGSSWTAARVLARERSPRATIPDPPAGVPLLLAARAPSGLYGPVVQIAAPGWAPPNVVQRLLEDDLSPSPTGTHDGTQWNGTDLVLELQSGVLSGNYTSVELDRTFQAPWFWQVRHDAQEIEDGLVSELDDEPGIGEALWALVSGRPASPASPGLDWRERVQDDDMPVGDDPATNLVRGPVGVVGSHTQTLVESRFYVDGAWTAYRPHVDGVVLASRMQVRVTLGRRALRYRPRVRLLTYTAYL